MIYQHWIRIRRNRGAPLNVLEALVIVLGSSKNGDPGLLRGLKGTMYELQMVDISTPLVEGVTLVSQWTGWEYKELEKVFLSIIASAADGVVVSAVWAALDFIYFAHFKCHSNSTLKKLEATWTDFHERKSIFITHGVCKQFNIPKLHSMQHYLNMIKSHGTMDNFNTEFPEQLHIDVAKDTFDHTNKMSGLTV